MRSTFNRLKACVTSEQALLAAVTLLALGSLPAQAAWEEKYYNPKPLADDVILPMPCEGSLVLRKVQVPVASPMGDYGVTLGQDSDEWGYMSRPAPATSPVVSPCRNRNQGAITCWPSTS